MPLHACHSLSSAVPWFYKCICVQALSLWRDPVRQDESNEWRTKQKSTVEKKQCTVEDGKWQKKKKKRSARMTERIKKQRKGNKSKRDTVGGHREQIASGLETEETVGNTLTQQRPEAHLLLNKKKKKRQRGWPGERGGETTEGENGRQSRIDVCERDRHQRDSVSGMRWRRTFFLQRTDRTYLKAKLWSKFTTRARREEVMETGDTDTVQQRSDILITWFCARSCLLSYVPIKSTRKDTVKMYWSPTGEIHMLQLPKSEWWISIALEENRLHTFHVYINDHDATALLRLTVIHTCMVWSKQKSI